VFFAILLWTACSRVQTRSATPLPPAAPASPGAAELARAPLVPSPSPSIAVRAAGPVFVLVMENKEYESTSR
jgi:hypothetical protein